MKILAFSDLHRNVPLTKKIVEASTRADVVVGAGDFATKQIGLSDTIDELRKNTTPTILVPGNHDDVDKMRLACEGWDNGYVLHGDQVMVGEQAFFGLGYEVPTRTTDPWSRYLEEAQAAEMLANVPSGCVLVTHTPPFGASDLQSDATHEGSQSIREAVIGAKPKLHLCGHIHHAFGTSDRINATSVFNLGPSVNWFDV